MNENELKTENTMTEEATIEAATTETPMDEAPVAGLTLPLIWHAEDKEELLDSTFNHSTETVRKDTKMDLLLTAVGIFAIICFGVMLYQCIHFNSFSLTNYICFVCYLIIAILFIPKPMQCFLSKMGWEINLSKFAASSQKASEVTLHDEKAEFVIGKKTVSVSYKYMEAIFETDNYFVLMIESKRILTFSKSDLSEEQMGLIREILAPYLAEEGAQTEAPENEADVEEDNVEAGDIKPDFKDIKTDDEIKDAKLQDDSTINDSESQTDNEPDSTELQDDDTNIEE